MLARALCHVDNAYWIPHVRLHGRVARTHKTSQTAFRGFGGPQGMLVVEDILGRCAPLLGIDPVDLRRRNFYVDGQATPYGQVVRHPERLAAAWEQVLASGDVVRRRAEVAAFNAAHHHRKRGLAVTPVKFGISFNFTAFNQAGALVHVYKDGSVLINHGGTEMGQGLHTKMLQVAATTLGVPLARVRVAPTRTDKVPNTSATAASSSTDLNGGAVKDACEQVLARLREVDAGRGLAWEELVREAYFSRVQLWAAGFYRTEGIHWDSTQMSGHPFKYFAYGVAAAEVEVDGFTGAHRTRRVDIVHDVGDSLSPLVDLGQVEGGFVQGVGWLTMEDLRWDESDGPGRGRLTTQSASTYKLPSLGELPDELNVALLEHAHEDGAVYGSKAVGEPPLMLAFAVREALREAVAAFGPEGASVELASPATPEAVFWAVGARPGRGPRPRRRGPARCRARPAGPGGAAPPPPVRAGGPHGGGGLTCTGWERSRGCGSSGWPGCWSRSRTSAGTLLVTPAPRWWSRRRRRGAASGAATSRRRPSPAPGRCSTRGPTHPSSSSLGLTDKARTDHGRQCCGGEVTLLLEPLPVVGAVAIFGVGHVGLQLARILAAHDLDLHLVDSRPGLLADERLALPADGEARVRVHHSPVPELALGAVPAGTHVLVMTHDHAEDFALCDAALRCTHLGSVGLIGSAAKWARFRTGLARGGPRRRHDRPHPLPHRAARPLLQAAGRDRRLGGRRADGPPDRRPRTDPEVSGAGVVYRARAYDAPDDPFTTSGPAFRYDDDLGLAVSDDGVITDRGPFASVAASRPDAPVIDLRSGLLLPGLVDTHVHFPQVRVIGALGMPLLEWLERCALPEEERLASTSYAATVAGELVAGLVAAGTTTSLVFGSHFAPAVDALFAEAERFGLRMTSGLVVSDRVLPEPLLTTPERSHDEAVRLAKDWHGRGRLRYAVTPRFALSASDAILAACADVLAAVDGACFTSHVNENNAEVATVADQFPHRDHYVDTYDHHGLLGRLLGAGAQRAPDRRRARRAGGPGHRGGLLPDEQRRPRLGDVLAAAPRRGGRARRARQRRRCGHRVLDLQGGPAGLLPAAPARRRRVAAGRGAPAAPQHRGGGGGAGPR